MEGERVAVAPASKHGGGAGAHALVLEPLGISIEAQEEAEGQDSADLRHTFPHVNYDLAMCACEGNLFPYCTLFQQQPVVVSAKYLARRYRGRRDRLPLRDARHHQEPGGATPAGYTFLLKCSSEPLTGVLMCLSPARFRKFTSCACAKLSLHYYLHKASIF